MDLIGITLEDLGEAETVEVWPENWEAFLVLDAMGTQWIEGFNGRTGLMYPSLPVTIELLGLQEVDKVDLFARVRLMENVALKTMSKSKG